MKKEYIKVNNEYQQSNICRIILHIADKTDFNYSYDRNEFYQFLNKIIDKDLLTTKEKDKILNDYQEQYKILK
jgi:hypothetical protein